jgi:hypothetical protein
MLGAGETTVGQTDRFVPQAQLTGFHRLATQVPLKVPSMMRAAALR